MSDTHFDSPGNSAFHHEELQQRCLNNLALVQRVVEAFLASGADTVEEIAQLAATKQWESLALAAHRLKGSGDNVAAPRLRHLAAEIEALVSGDPKDCDRSILSLRNEWERFEQQARAYLGRGDMINNE
jgi:HPt (histidine-containing phosphotransfer) domain-containing protein